MRGVAVNGAAHGYANAGFQPEGPAWADPLSGQGTGTNRDLALGSAEPMLGQIQQTSEALLHRVQAPQFSPSATQSLEQALTAQAQRVLNEQLRDALAALDDAVAGSRSASPCDSRVGSGGGSWIDSRNESRVGSGECSRAGWGSEARGEPPVHADAEVASDRSRMLETLCDLARRADVEVARQQLAEDICLTANGLRQALSQASPSDIQSFVVDLSSLADASHGTEAREGAALEALVADVRRSYGEGLVTARPLRSAKDIEPDVRQIVDSLRPGLMDALKRFKLSSQDHEQEALQALRQAAVVLVDHELDTPGKVQEFLGHARRWDDWLAFGTGLLAQVGYPVGMSAFLWGVGPQLAPVLLGAESGFRGAAAFGAVAGAMIGYFDSVAGAGASAMRSALSYAGSGGTTSPLVNAMKPSEPRDIGIRLGISALATFTKNALLRAVLPSVVYAAAYPQGVSRAIRDHVDFAGDAGGGLFSGAAATLLTRRALDSRSSQDFKLLTQDNLPEMIQRAKAGTRWSWGAVRSLSAFGRGLGQGAMAPSTLAVTGLVMTPLVALLMGINIGVVSGLGLSDGGNSGDGEADASAQTHILAAEHALKATVSSLLMAVLAGAATGVGQWVGRHADADCLAAVFGAVRAAAQRLRAGPAVSDTPAAIELTGMRRRAVGGGQRGETPAHAAEGPTMGHAGGTAGPSKVSTIARGF